MKRIYLLALVALFAACSESKQDPKALTLPEGQLPTMAGTSTTPPPAGVTVNPAHGQPGHDCALPVGAPLGNAQQITAQGGQAVTMPQPGATNISSGALNPEHGKPGHRCDIAVGAPLNAASTTTSQTVSTAAPVSNSTAKGMNPSHGQPGHRCDIAVGAPLNSKATVTGSATPAPAPIKEAAVVQEANGG